MPIANVCSSSAVSSTTTSGWSNGADVPKDFDDEGDTDDGVVEGDELEDVDDEAEEELDGRRVGTGIVSFASSLLLTTSYCGCCF
jgi:hypothetical protein